MFADDDDDDDGIFSNKKKTTAAPSAFQKGKPPQPSQKVEVSLRHVKTALF